MTLLFLMYETHEFLMYTYVYIIYVRARTFMWAVASPCLHTICVCMFVHNITFMCLRIVHVARCDDQCS